MAASTKPASLRSPGQATNNLTSKQQDLTEWLHDRRHLDAGQLPAVSISLRDVGWTREVPETHHAVQNVFGYLTSAAAVWKKKATRTLKILDGVNLDVRPGTMTLVLGAPGSGKSSLLKVLAGRHRGMRLSGSTTYNGVSAGDMGRGIKRLIKLVSAEDEHMALLTVRETLRYAGRFQAVDASEERVNSVLRVLQLDNCAETFVGNEFIRGISGGEKKRLTLAEQLMGNARVLCLDEYSTGLDSSTAYDITRGLRQWAVDTNGTVVASLLQPIPEMYDLFDQVVLLQEGHVVYAGPRENALPWVESQVGVSCPADQDYADFMVSYLGDPVTTVRAAHRAALDTPMPTESKAEHDTGAGSGAGAGAGVRAPGAGDGPDVIEPPPRPPSASVLAAAFRETQALEQPQVSQTLPPDRNSFAHRQYGPASHLSVLSEAVMCLTRQAKVYFRDKDNLVGPWVVQGIMLGLLVGSLFWSLGLDDFSIKSGYWLFMTTILFGFNLTELPIAALGKLVVEKQVDSGYYSPSAFVISAAITQLPFALVNLFTLGTISYWMVGLSPVFTDYLMFALVFFFADLALSALFRSITLYSPTLTIAEVAAPLVVVIVFIFSGVVITRTNLEPWVVWIYYLSPLSYTVRAFAIIEARSEDYDNAPLNADGQNIGLAGLDSLDYQSERIWIWMGVLFLAVFYLVQLSFSIIAVKFVRYARITGTSRLASEGDPSDVQLEVRGASATHALPITPMAVTWDNLCYTVHIKKDGDNPAHDRQLLDNIRGIAQPGRMVALMGASGAGKTTLLDVLADRKSTGEVTGSIVVGGQERAKLNYNRVVGYVQQHDAHIGTASVREALEFSAKLRLPTSVTVAQRHALVDEVLTVLELSSVSEWVVSSLSAGQAKRLTIGIELCANPSVLFLDEPTTGLDSRAAMVVLRVVHNIARAGRTIVCTIHQPSAEMFFMFDDLLLLQRGGLQAYFGPVGLRGAAVAEYFQALPGTSPLPPRMNVATWMVEVVATAEKPGAAGPPKPADLSATPLVVDTAFRDAFMGSTSAAAATAAIVKANQSVTATTSLDESNFPSYGTQLGIVLARTWRAHARALDYNVSRVVAMPVLGFCFGLVFFDLGINNLADIQSALGAVMLLSGFNAVILMQTAGPHVFTLRAAFYRESSSQTYTPTLFGISYALVEIPWVALMMLAATAIGYFMIGFDSDFDRFLLFYVAVAVLCLASSYNGYAWGSLLPNHQILQIAVGGTQNLMWLFNGFFIPGGRVPQGYKWLFQLLPYNHALDPLAMSQFHGLDNQVEQVDGTLTSADRFVSRTYDYNYDDRWQEVGILFAYVAFWLILFFLGVKYVRHVK